MNRPEALAVQKLAKDFKIMIITQSIWLVTVFALVAWWGYLLYEQAGHISHLEQLVGTNSAESLLQLEKTQRMLLWEGGTFIVLLLTASAILVWLYWRDVKRSNSLGIFFASVTHELKTPLTSIRLQAESIADKNVSPSEKTPMAERLLEDTNRLETQVERTLELARVEAGGEVFTESLDIKPWLDKTLRHWRESRTGKIKILSDVEDQLVEADSSALQVIIKNLLENSVKHAGNNSALEVSITGKSNGTPYLEIFFKDNGRGFNGNIKDLGKLFYKGAHSQGTGVGLYLIRVLMNRMGGSVTFNNRDDGEQGFVTQLRFKKSQALEK